MKWSKGIQRLSVSVMIGFCAMPGLALAQKMIVFDPTEHKWYAYDNGQLIRSGIASGGRDYCADSGHKCHTPSGTFSIIRKGGADCKSTRYPLPHGGAPMPYCMYFTDFYAIHGSYELSATANISHGCIRIHPDAARWLNQNFANIGTKVVIRPY
jgi:lipoprotein-anchoring transpeptidase ErfK/SrfK